MCAGIAVHVVLQIAGTGDLVPAVRKARLKEHMTRAESLYKIVGNPEPVGRVSSAVKDLLHFCGRGRAVQRSHNAVAQITADMVEGAGTDVSVIVVLPEAGGIEHVLAECNIQKAVVTALIVIRDHKRTVFLALDLGQCHDIPLTGIGGRIHPRCNIRQRYAAVLEFARACVSFINSLHRLEMQDHAVLRPVGHGAHRGSPLGS